LGGMDLKLPPGAETRGGSREQTPNIAPALEECRMPGLSSS